MNIEALLNENEGKSLDFKEVLNLSTKDDKAEFSKDIAAIANSVDKKGFLVFGISDNKNILGLASPLEEETIQQTCSRRITPPVDLTVKNITYKEKLIGIIEIKPLAKPHKISQDSGSIKKEDVYIRRGSVIFKASAEEINNMYVKKSKEYFYNMKYFLIIIPIVVFLYFMLSDTKNKNTQSTEGDKSPIINTKENVTINY